MKTNKMNLPKLPPGMKNPTRRRKEDVSFIDGVAGCIVHHPVDAEGCTCDYENVPFAAIHFTGKPLEMLREVADIWNKHPYEFDLGSDANTDHTPASVLCDAFTGWIERELKDHLHKRLADYRHWLKEQERTKANRAKR